VIILSQPAVDDLILLDGSVAGTIVEVSGERTRVRWKQPAAHGNTAWLDRTDIFIVGGDEHFKAFWEVEPVSRFRHEAQAVVPDHIAVELDESGSDLALVDPGIPTRSDG
jgi:hypothetical protein